MIFQYGFSGPATFLYSISLKIEPQNCINYLKLYTLVSLLVKGAHYNKRRFGCGLLALRAAQAPAPERLAQQAFSRLTAGGASNPVICHAANQKRQPVMAAFLIGLKPQKQIQ